MKFVKTSKILLLSTIMLPALNAITIQESVKKLLVSNPEIIAEKHNQEAFKKYIDERRGNYYPRIDIDGRLEKSKTRKNYYDSSRPENGNSREEGYNIGIALNQILYDGNLTPTRIEEAKHNYHANRYRTQRNMDEIVQRAVKAYTDLIKYDELLKLTKSMINTNEENLQIAMEKESISGEVLETYQVKSKLNFVKEKYFEEEDLKSSKRSTFKRYMGTLPDGTECRPKLDFTKIPESLQETVEKAILKNTEILEQIEKIKAQREKIAVIDSRFLPNLNLELKATKDKDLSLNEEGIENQVFGRLNFSWNLYNGGGDYAVTKQEELFLLEQKQRLDSITNKIVEKVKVNFQRIQKNQKRIIVLKQYVEANENIVKVYKDEFDSGTRTFVDILDAQTVLYEAKKNLINREYELYDNYYDLLNTLGILTNTILSSENQECVASSINLKNQVKKADVEDELKDLLEGENTQEAEEDLEQETDIKEAIEDESNSDLNNGMDFLDKPSSYYTVNLATKKSLDSADSFIKENKLYDFKAYAYEFGENEKSTKIIYGVFESVKEAKKAIESLPKKIKSTKPYVDNVSKHQKLYKKYH